MLGSGVRPERRVVLADERSVRVSAEAPGSKFPEGGAIRPYEAECQKPLKGRVARKRAATLSKRCSLVKLSAERCSKGPSRSHHGEGKRQHSENRMEYWTSPGEWAVARFQRRTRNRRDLPWRPCRAKIVHKARKAASAGGREGVRGASRDRSMRRSPKRSASFSGMYPVMVMANASGG